MRWTLIVLALLGIVAASLALREHDREEGDAPCSINERWDCGIVNKSPYAVMGGVPVAVIGIIGYVLLAGLAFARQYRIALAAALAGLGFSLYLAHIEKDILGVWCAYCVISLGVISAICLVLVAELLVSLRRTHSDSRLNQT